MARVLIIDDDSGVRTLLRDLLEDAGYEVIDADNGDSGFNLYAANPADLVLTDIYMPMSQTRTQRVRRESPSGFKEPNSSKG